MRAREMTEISLLAVLIAVTGSFKLPAMMPGLDFQMSAPLAVAICVVFGFKRYFVAGCIASLVMLLLGTQNFLNTVISIEFRLIAGAVLYLGRNALWAQCIAGPIGSILARISLYVFFGKFAYAALLAAVPGYIFTAVMAPIFVLLLKKVRVAVPQLER